MSQLLHKGDHLSLTQLAEDLSEIIVVPKCFTDIYDINEFEIDVSAILLTDQSKVRNDADFIFFRQPHSVDNAVFLKDRMFKVILPNISPEITRIIFVTTLYDTNQLLHFGYFDQIVLKVFNFATKRELLSFTIEDITTEATIMLAQLQREADEWIFNALGRGQVKGLESLARNYGIKLPSDYFGPPSQQVNDELVVEDIIELNEPVFEAVEPVAAAVVEEVAAVAEVTTVAEPPKNEEFLALQTRYQPVMDRYQQQLIIQKSPIDISLLFDDIAVALGRDYNRLAVVSDNIKIRQRKGYSTVNIDLSAHKESDIEVIRGFCKDLLDYGFISNFYYIKDKKTLALSLHRLPSA